MKERDNPVVDVKAPDENADPAEEIDPRQTIQVAMVVPRTEAEGPGARFAIWVQGCPLHCRGCCNPEMIPFVPATPRTAESLVLEAVAASVEGISLLGGEPFAQAEGLAAVAEGVRAHGLSVMVFSGYRLEELRSRPSLGVQRLLEATDVLVDGRFEADRKSTTRRFVGSDNQVLHCLTERYSSEDPRFHGSNHVELRLVGGKLTINGWPMPGLDFGRGRP